MKNPKSQEKPKKEEKPKVVKPKKNNQTPEGKAGNRYFRVTGDSNGGE